MFPLGEIYTFGVLSSYITNSQQNDNVWQCQVLRSMYIFDSQMFITQLGNINQIKSVRITFCSDDGSDVLGADGNLIEYTSSRQDLGHMFNFPQDGFVFAYARIFLSLESNSNFDPHSLCFHFPRPLSPGGSRSEKH